MQVNIHTIKLGVWRSLLRTMPLILMGALTLVTFWLVKKNTPSELSSPERIRIHEPDYTLVNGTVSALNEAGTTKYRLLGRKIAHYDDDASIDIDEPRMRLFLIYLEMLKYSAPHKPPLQVKLHHLVC